MNQKLLRLVPTESSIVESPRHQCTVAGCTSTFGNISNLQMHLNKHHRIETKKIVDRETIVQYFCPVEQCKHNQNAGNNFFKSRKYLRQHYLKVHAIKSEKCTKCDRSFASASLKNQHERCCGIIFQCFDCEWNYTSRECLLTHCRRKGHRIPPKEAKIAIEPQKSKLIAENIEPNPIKVIAPKPNLVDTSNQTENMIKKVQNILKSTPAATKIRANFEQIMLKSKKAKSETKVSQTTQTASLYDDNCKKVISSSNKVAAEQNQSEKYKSLDLIDEESNTMGGEDPTQANKNLNNLSYVEDDSNLHYFTVSNFNAGLCHIETQTEFMPFDQATMETNDMDPLLCHMSVHTQTSDDILTELGLTNIQTQTNWPDDEYNDLFVSAETQTCNFDTPLMIDNICSKHKQQTEGVVVNSCCEHQV